MIQVMCSRVVINSSWRWNYERR